MLKKSVTNFLVEKKIINEKELEKAIKTAKEEVKSLEEYLL